MGLIDNSHVCISIWTRLWDSIRWDPGLWDLRPWNWDPGTWDLRPWDMGPWKWDPATVRLATDPHHRLY